MGMMAAKAEPIIRIAITRARIAGSLFFMVLIPFFG
jgi:hypothetical protein